MRKKRLWRRLFLAYLWVPVLVLLSIGWYGSDVVRQLYFDHMKNDLEARARLCGRQIGDLDASFFYRCLAGVIGKSKQSVGIRDVEVGVPPVSPDTLATGPELG